MSHRAGIVELYIDGVKIEPKGDATPRPKRPTELVSGSFSGTLTLTAGEMEAATAALAEYARWFQWLTMWRAVGALAAWQLQYERELCSGEPWRGFREGP